MGESFAFEDEELFRLAREVAVLGDRIATEHRRRRPWLAEQFGKASLSVLNNSAEAHGEFARQDKSRF